MTGLSGIIIDDIYFTGTAARQANTTVTRNSASLSVRTDDTHETGNHPLNTVECNCGCDYFMVSLFFLVYVEQDVKQLGG